MRSQDQEQKKYLETLEERAKNTQTLFGSISFLYFGLEKSILQMHDGKDRLYLQCVWTKNWEHIEYKSAASKEGTVLGYIIVSLVFWEREVVVRFFSVWVYTERWVYTWIMMPSSGHHKSKRTWALRGMLERIWLNQFEIWDAYPKY